MIQRTRRRGFTMLLAIACLALAGVAVTLVVGLASDDARRTIAERRDMQQRQLLLAGLRVVDTRLDAGESIVVGAVEVPEMAGIALSIKDVRALSPDRTVVTFDADGLAQRATFGRVGGRWTMAGVEIIR